VDVLPKTFTGVLAEVQQVRLVLLASSTLVRDGWIQKVDQTKVHEACEVVIGIRLTLAISVIDAEVRPLPLIETEGTNNFESRACPSCPAAVGTQVLLEFLQFDLGASPAARFTSCTPTSRAFALSCDFKTEFAPRRR